LLPDSEHNEALAGDTLYNVSFNYEWRKIVVYELSASMARIAATIEDETEYDTFVARVDAMIEDFYSSETMVTESHEAIRSTTIAIAANTPTLVNFTTGGIPSIGGNPPHPERVPVPMAGNAVVTARLSITSVTAGVKLMKLLHNGTEINRVDYRVSSQAHYLHVSHTMEVADGDYFGLEVESLVAATVQITPYTPRLAIVVAP
jgi:hypothetical protein